MRVTDHLSRGLHKKGLTVVRPFLLPLGVPYNEYGEEVGNGLYSMSIT